MKRFFYALIFPAIVFSASAQNTWVQRLNFSDMSPYENTDSITGIRDIQLSADGSLLVLAFLNQDNRQLVMKIPVTGAPIIWSTQVGAHGGITGMYTRNICPTADSGFVISRNPWGEAMMYETFGTVEKYSKFGTVEWSYQFSPNTNGNPPYYDKAVFDVIQNNSGNYYALVGDGSSDSLYEFNATGNIVFATDTINGFQLYQMPNNQLLVQRFDTTLECRDITGNLFWSTPSRRVLAFTPTYAFVLTYSGIEKVNTTNGTVVWTKNYPFAISAVSPTADGGFIGTSGTIPRGVTDYAPDFSPWINQVPGILCRVDSAGDTLWTKSFSFPEFGLSSVKQLPSGDIVTGGGFIFTNEDHEMFGRDYSAFLASLDSMGNGTLQTTSYIWPGNSNDNSINGFVDDALFTGIALGYSGPRRDTLDTLFNSFRIGMQSDYATDWPDTFNNGVNYKHADFNGDGIVDTNDINLYTTGVYGYYQPFTIYAWRFSNSINHSSSLPDLQFVPEHDTVEPGNQIKFFIVAGSSSVPVDSIYGLAFATLYNYFLISDTASVSFYNSGFGTNGTDLFSVGFPNSFGGGVNGLACRTNRQNVYNINDTIGEIRMTASDTITSTQTLDLTISDFNALTYHQSAVQFNLIGGSVVIDPTLLSVNEKQQNAPVLYPNPTSGFLFVKNLSAGNKKISIINSLGENVKVFESSEKRLQLATDDLPNGIYTISIQSDATVDNKTFIVQH